MIVDTEQVPAADRRTVVIIHRDSQDDVVYWCGPARGSGSGWTADRSEAMEFATFTAANAERRVCRRMHPTMRTEMQASWIGDEP